MTGRIGLAVAAVMLMGTVPSARAQDASEVIIAAPGPALWRVSKGASTVWVLGTTQVRQGQVWSSARLGGLLDGARALIPTPRASADYTTASLPASARLADGRSLDTELPETLRGRYYALRARLQLDPHRWDGLKPAWAAIVLLREVRDAAALTEAEPTVESLAQARRVPILPAPHYNASAIDGELGQMPPEAGQGVLADAVDAAEHQLAHASHASAAWARGDIAGVRADMGPEDLESWVLRRTIALRKVQARGVSATVDAIGAALSKPGQSVMTVSLPTLIRRDGAVDRLRAQGFKVVEPGERLEAALASHSATPAG